MVYFIGAIKSSNWVTPILLINFIFNNFAVQRYYYYRLKRRECKLKKYLNI